jgi:hypothetical protein
MKPQRRINLAMSALRGNREAFRKLGVEYKVGAMGELDAIMRDALNDMTPEEQADDERQTMCDLDKAIGN